ncbi:Putative transcriptional regulatory protein [Podospora comata]|uniref:Transcriptional regulatory protein n=1 Tax=Podospora comata TaxID=48703 RepID=A0ABY6S6R2_PODCO|nr:Putative transcriptional regulatory protein [Podospora comata]
MATEQHLEQPPSPSRLPITGSEPSVMKLTRGHSCVLCQQRKVRCDKQKPCANCLKAQVECRVVPPQPPRRRKKKPHERDLIERLRKYEHLMSQHGLSFEPIAQDLRPSDNGDDVADLEQDLSGLKTSPSSTADHVSPDQANDKSKWYPNNSYYKDQYRNADDDSSDEDYEGPTLHHAYDAMFDNNDGFPFVVGGATQSVTSHHPPAIQMFQLWQIYISNVNPLLKINHTPTLQAQIISASTAINKISRPLEALMFAIYFAAITSMNDDEVQSTFGEDKAVLLGKYHHATQQALVNAGFMRSTDLAVLQALFLYLLCVRQYVDPRSLFCLIGMAVRIATRLGIHRDGAQFGLTPFETEQRRRLWWQLVIFDKRVAEITGSSITALSTCASDCNFPSNVNDTDLSVHAKDHLPPHHGPTEMVFCLTRIELTVASSQTGNMRPGPSTPGGRPGVNNKAQKVQYSPSPSSPDLVTHVANQTLPHDLASFHLYIENRYLKHCDQRIPLHSFTLLMTRQALSKLRVIDFLTRSSGIESVNPAEREELFIEAIRTVELDNMIQRAPELQGFRWYTYQHFPFPAYIFLISELRVRTTGSLCERAWDAMIENHDRRGLLRRNLRSPLHIAFGHFFVKAWDAREQAELQLGRVLPTPQIVTLLRNTVSKMKRPTGPPLDGGDHQASVPGPPVALPPPIVGGNDPPPGLYPGKGMPLTPETTGPVPGAGPQVGPPGGPGPGMMAMGDAPVMFNGYEGLNPLFNSASGPGPGGGQVGGPGGGGGPGGMEEMDFGQMDWNYLVQYSSFGAFNPAYYHQGGAGPAGSHP